MELNGINDLMRKRFSEQHRGRNMIWSIALNEIKAYFHIDKIDPEIEDEIITWYIKINKIFLKISDQQLKIQIFKEKSQIITIINKKLAEIWYNNEIQDIILK